MRVAIIGAGLAGCAAAYVLKHAGADPVVYEMGAEIAPGASGNPAGLYNPRISAERGFYSDAFPMALAAFEQLQDIDWNPCGALHLITDDTKRKRFAEATKSWGWAREDMHLVSKAEASEIAGVGLVYDALYLRRSGTVSPKKLCRAYVANVPVILNKRVESIEELKADVVIVAAGMETKDLPLKAVRGQLTQVKATEFSRQLKCCLCYGGYFSPAKLGMHAIGSTFQRWLDHADVMEEDDQDNILKLVKIMPELAEGLEVAGHRAGLRTASPDHFPMVGHLRDNIYVSTAHGSHGIISSIGAAHILASVILKKPQRFPPGILAKINPARFKRPGL